MGKIRVKTLGDETAEKEQKKETQKRIEAKKVGKAPGLKGGQRINVVGPSEEELAQIEEPSSSVILESEAIPESQKGTDAGQVFRSRAQDRGASMTKKSQKAKGEKKTKARARSKRYKEALIQVDRTKKYSLSEALQLLPKVGLAKYDETVELHINTIEPVAASITLPYTTGKKVRIAIANDETIKKIEAGKIDFDILLAEPAYMPKLAKVARILGPKGLMPNPKNGTITTNPTEAMKKYEEGLTSFKTEAKAPIMHTIVGKISFGDKKLSENIKMLIASVKKEKIINATLKSTMSPGIKIDILSV